MEVVVVGSEDELGELAAEVVAGLLADRPDAVLGLATGSSPLPLYRALARRVAAGLDLRRVRGFALDEYVGLPPDHPAGYHRVILEEVVEPLGLDPAAVAVPDGAATDVRAACAAYEAAIAAAGGVDLQVLGIGSDGHVGFNEPGSSLASRTRIKTLTDRTREDNRRFFAEGEDVPRHCLTQGIGTILEARHLLLLASGAGKAAAVAAAVEGPVSARCPASAIQLHPHVTVVVDEAAAGDLELVDYYRETFAHKPSWQGF
ncbi:MAG: glucosamine-6-phosphate deaminase [Nocardioidaceae bacterium]